VASRSIRNVMVARILHIICHFPIMSALAGIAASPCCAGIPFSDIDPGEIPSSTILPKQMHIAPLQKPIQPSKPSLMKPRFPDNNILPYHMQFTPITKPIIRKDYIRPQWTPKHVIEQDTILQNSIKPKPLTRSIQSTLRLPTLVRPSEPKFQFDPSIMRAGRPHTYFNSSIFLCPPTSTFPDEAGTSNGSASQSTENRRRSLGW